MNSEKINRVILNTKYFSIETSVLKIYEGPKIDGAF